MYTSSSFTQPRLGWVSCGFGSYLNAVIVQRCKQLIDTHTHTGIIVYVRVRDHYSPAAPERTSHNLTIPV